MNTLEKDRKNYALQMHVVRLHTFAKHAERKKNIPHGRKRKTLTYTFLLITACFCCYLKTYGLIKYPACSHLASKPSKKAELDTSPLKQTIENLQKNFMRIYQS